MKELNKKLAIVQTKLKAKKSSYNSFGKYYFRKSEDILEAIKPFLIEHGVTVTINEEMISTDPVPTMQSTATISDGENAIHATALVGVDLNQKGMQTAQQFGAASTYGKKYALGNLLLIDDNSRDDDDMLYQIEDTSEPYNQEFLSLYLISLLKQHLNINEFEVLRLSYGLDCEKQSAKQIAKELGIEGVGAYVRVSQLKKQAVDKLIENVDHSQVLDYL